MRQTEVVDYAHKLLKAYGDRAEAEAAQKARVFAEKHNDTEAAVWRRIQEAIRKIRSAPAIH